MHFFLLSFDKLTWEVTEASKADFFGGVGLAWGDVVIALAATTGTDKDSPQSRNRATCKAMV